MTEKRKYKRRSPMVGRAPKSMLTRHKDALLIRLMDEGWTPSAIDEEMKFEKGYTHDWLVQAWTTNDPALLHRQMKGVKHVEDLDEPEPAPKKPRTREKQMNSVVAKRYAGRKLNGVKYDLSLIHI